MPRVKVACPECGNLMDPLSKRCARCAGVGRNCGGPKLTKSGYRRVWAPDHPLANGDGNVLEHRKVLHDAGVEIPVGYHVHHRDGNKRNNDLANLEVKRGDVHSRDHVRDAGFVINQYGVWPLRSGVR